MWCNFHTQEEKEREKERGKREKEWFSNFVPSVEWESEGSEFDDVKEGKIKLFLLMKGSFDYKGNRFGKEWKNLLSPSSLRNFSLFSQNVLSLPPSLSLSIHKTFFSHHSSHQNASIPLGLNFNASCDWCIEKGWKEGTKNVNFLEREDEREREERREKGKGEKREIEERRERREKKDASRHQGTVFTACDTTFVEIHSQGSFSLFFFFLSLSPFVLFFFLFFSSVKVLISLFLHFFTLFHPRFVLSYKNVFRVRFCDQ